MHPSIHQLSIIGDREAGLALLPAAEKELGQLLGRLAIAGTRSGAQYRRLSGTAYCYVRVAGEVNLINIVVGYDQARADVPEELLRLQPPDLLSGVVAWGLLSGEDEEGAAGEVSAGIGRIDFGASRQRVLNSYYPTLGSQRLHGLEPGRQASPRLAVEAWRDITTTLQLGQQVRKVSQYQGLRPTMYSGRMKAVVQALMGLGKLPERTRYSTLLDAEEQAELGPIPASAYDDEVARDGYQVRYDFRWFRTHGIGVAADGRLWLVEIGGTRGVLAMPLPLNRYTVGAFAERYRKRAEKLGDTAALTCLDTFGGIPSGETFPDKDEDLEALIRAGQVLRLLTVEQLAPFYALTGLSSACGWAFNQSGSEAHNTGYGFHPDGLQFCAHYNINLRIAATREPNGSGARATIGAALAGQAERLGAVRFAAALAKLDYLSAEEIRQQYQLLRSEGASGYLDRLDALVIEPIAPGSAASLGLAGKGNMANAQRASVYNLKLWEPAWLEERSILSHDFSANAEPAIRFAECDTTVFVFFAGDQLKTVKWFATNRRTEGPEVESDYEDCMYIGKWSKTVAYGGRSVDRAFYSQDFDDREELAGAVDYEEIESRKLGPTGAAWNDWRFPPERGTLSRSVVFRRRTYRKSIGGQGQTSAVVCLPAYLREACYYAVRRTQIGISESESWSDHYLPDPWSAEYVYSIYDPAAKGPCGSLHLTRRVERTIHTEAGCSDVADSGPWMRVCDLVAAPKVGNIAIGGGISPYYPNPSYPPLPAGWATGPDYRGTLRVKLVYFGGAVDLPEESGDSHEWVNQELSWFLPSPEVALPGGGTKGYLMHMWSTANALGESQALVLQAEPDAAEETRYADGMPYIVNQGCFVGVVDG